jgi:small subunit ribosomal protein S16
MAVKLRLRREGGKRDPFFRVVAADSRAPRDGRFLEIVGQYDPTTDPSSITIDEERALYWLRVGAQPTDQVRNLLEIVGVWERFKPGQAPKREHKTGSPVRGSDAAARPEAQVADASQTRGGGDAPAEQSAAAPEEIEAGEGGPEDATAEPVAETDPSRGSAEGAPGEGVVESEAEGAR